MASSSARQFEYKAGVPGDTMHPYMYRGIEQCVDVYKSYNKRLVVTSTTDGVHMEGSKHYEGLAFDIRTNYFKTKEQVEEVAKKIRLRLGCMFDVVVEATHIHIEWRYEVL